MIHQEINNNLLVVNKVNIYKYVKLSFYKMELQVDEKTVIPEQGLENKLAYVAKITHVFPSDYNGKRVEMTTIENAQAVRVQIRNKSDTLNGSSGMVYKPEDFAKFQKAYAVTDAEDLVGKPVISVYTKNYGQMLCGLIPLNMD